MSTRRIIIVAGAALAVGAGAGAAAGALAVTGSSPVGDDRDERATGPGADRARAAALARYSGATVTALEREDDEAAYEVELSRTDGTTVDVEVDRAGKIVETDVEGKDDDVGERDDD